MFKMTLNYFRVKSRFIMNWFRSFLSIWDTLPNFQNFCDRENLSEADRRIRELNDQFRQTFIGGRILLTRGVQALPIEVANKVIQAIQTFDEEVKDVFGNMVVLNKPFIVPDLCIGCGICHAECPVQDDPAVYVTAVGESRSKDRKLLLRSRTPLKPV